MESRHFLRNFSKKWIFSQKILEQEYSNVSKHVSLREIITFEEKSKIHFSGIHHTKVTKTMFLGYNPLAIYRFQLTDVQFFRYCVNSVNLTYTKNHDNDGTRKAKCPKNVMYFIYALHDFL